LQRPGLTKLSLRGVPAEQPTSKNQPGDSRIRDGDTAGLSGPKVSRLAFDIYLLTAEASAVMCSLYLQHARQFLRPELAPEVDVIRKGFRLRIASAKDNAPVTSNPHRHPYRDLAHYLRLSCMPRGRRAALAQLGNPISASRAKQSFINRPFLGGRTEAQEDESVEYSCAIVRPWRKGVIPKELLKTFPSSRPDMFA